MKHAERRLCLGWFNRHWPNRSMRKPCAIPRIQQRACQASQKPAKAASLRYDRSDLDDLGSSRRGSRKPAINAPRLCCAPIWRCVITGDDRYKGRKKVSAEQVFDIQQALGNIGKFEVLVHGHAAQL